MSLLSLDGLIVAAFLLVTLAIGIRAGQGVKTVREYAIAGKRYGTTALVLTFLATDIGGGTVFGNVKEVFTQGPINTLALLGLSLSFLWRAFFIAPRMHRFRCCLTMGDVMETLYGSQAKVCTGFLNVLTSGALMAIQMVALGMVFESFLGINARWGTLVCGLGLAAYTCHGGIRAVTATDVFHFVVLFAAVPIVAALALKEAGGIGAVCARIPAEKFLIGHHPKREYYFSVFIVYGLFSNEMLQPASFHRLLMAKNARQLQRKFLAVAAFDPAFRAAVMTLALAALALYPHLAPEAVWPTIVTQLLPIGLRGLIVAGFLAVIMSTADSSLHAAGLAFSRDFLAPLYNTANRKLDELKWTRLGTFVAALLGIYMSFQTQNLLGLSMKAAAMSGPLLTAPLLAGIMGLKPSKKVLYFSAAATLLSYPAAAWLLSPERQFWSLPITLSVNVVSFLLAHLVRYGKFVRLPASDQAAASEQVPDSALPYRKMAQRERARLRVTPYGLFGIFCCLNFTLPYFLWSHQIHSSETFVIWMRFLGAVLCSLLIVRKKWPWPILRHLSLYWHFTLLYCIPFTSTVMFLLTQGSTEWLINVGIAIMFLIVLVDWATFFLLSGLGIALGFLFYRVVIGPIHLDLDFTTSYLLMYQGIFATLIGLLFARRKQQWAAAKEQGLHAQGDLHKHTLLATEPSGTETIQALQQQRVDQMFDLLKELGTLQVEKAQQNKFERLQAELVPIAFQLHGLHKPAAGCVRLKLERFELKPWLQALKERSLSQTSAHSVKVVLQSKATQIKADPQRLINLLLERISAACHHYRIHTDVFEEDEPVRLQLTAVDATLHYPLTDVGADYVKHVPALHFIISDEDTDLTAKLPVTFSPDLTSEPIESSESARAVSKTTSLRVLQAHYGHYEEREDTYNYPDTYCTYHIVVPQDVSLVRPRDADKPHMATGAHLIRADDRYCTDAVDAQKEEQTFLTEARAKSSVPMVQVKTALELIKWCHGPTPRKNKEPFYLHPVGVARIVLKYEASPQAILGALLHNTVEDTWIRLQEIEKVFGRETADVVDLVTRLQKVERSTCRIRLSTEENIRMLERAGNRAALCVKLAGRMHNMRTIAGHSDPEKRRAIAEETAALFVPLAHMLYLPEAVQELTMRCGAALKEL